MFWLKQAESEFSLPLPFLSLQSFNHFLSLRSISPVWENHLLAQFTYSDANLFWKNPHGHIQKSRLTSYLGIVWPSEVDTYN